MKNDHIYHIMKKSLYILSTACLLLTGACSTENDDNRYSQEQHARLVLQTRVVTFTETDGATRAADTWQWADGDVLYMQYYNGNRRVSGHAVYTASKQTWEAYHNGTLATAGACRLYYFQGASSADLRNVDLSEANAVYADTTATYTLRQGTIAVSAALRPLTARLRMKGASGLTARVNGLARYTGYSAQGDRLTLSREPLVVTVGNSGYTNHLYVCFADTAARTLSLTESADNHFYRFTRSFEANVLAQGTSGYLTIPTVDTNRGWTRTEAGHVSVSPDSLTFAWNATTAQTITVTADGAWTATTTATWLTVTGGTGTGNGSFTIKPNSQNTSTTADRTATITLTRGNATCIVKVTQQKQDAVSVAPASLTFAWDATATQTIAVKANGAWTATTTATWLTVTGGSGTGNGSFTVQPNSQNTSTTADRTATITLTRGNATCTVKVTQQKQDAVSVAPASLTFAWDATSTQTITVTANGAWTATTTATWLTVTDGTGTGNGSFTVQPKSQNTSTTADRTATITVRCGTKTATVGVTQKYYSATGYDNGYAWVDLGLSVRWATMNVGASSPTDYGDYYAWGETTTKTSYDWSTYKYCNGSSTTLTKYNNSTSYGTVDNKTTLEPDDDVAHVKWGGNWRMPTETEQSELYNTANCNWQWYEEGNSEFSGVAGWKVTSKKAGFTDKYIFLTAAGYRSGTSLINTGSYGYYWSSSLYTIYPYTARVLGFSYSGHYTNGIRRDDGHSVRPVTEP